MSFLLTASESQGSEARSHDRGRGRAEEGAPGDRLSDEGTRDCSEHADVGMYVCSFGVNARVSRCERVRIGIESKKRRQAEGDRSASAPGFTCPSDLLTRASLLCVAGLQKSPGSVWGWQMQCNMRSTH